jgi:hypothetical protein
MPEHDDGRVVTSVDLPPIEHLETRASADGTTPIEDGWYECPNCGSELNFNPSHDVYTEGFAPEARPDVWRCVDCRYTWAE